MINKTKKICDLMQAKDCTTLFFPAFYSAADLTGEVLETKWHGKVSKKIDYYNGKHKRQRSRGRYSIIG